MIYTIGLLAVAAVGAGLYFKKEETVALLKNVVAWVVAVGTAAIAYFGFDVSSLF